jgi:tetrahydromethanopterin S-methyltransferase subunit E
LEGTEGKLRVTVARKRSEAIMASLVVLILAAIVMGACVGAFLKLSFAIRREDRLRGSLWFDAPNHSAQAARAMVGVTSSRRD